MRLQLTGSVELSSSGISRVLCALGLTLSFSFAGLTPRARADAASGTYTGSVSLRGNYYFERSTRVVAPATTATLATPSGVRVEGTYLVDAITSASQATGVESDVGFTELRHDVQGGVGYELDLGNQQIDFSAQGRFSKEPDYRSRGLGFSAALNLNQRTSVLRLNGYFLHDTVYKVDRSAPAENPNVLEAAKPVRVGELDALSVGFAWDQVLTPTFTLTLGVDVASLEGFQANAYRIAVFQDGGLGPERHPNERGRRAAYLWLAHYIEATRSAIRLGYRFYQDSWDLLAHAPEARVHQELGQYVEVRLRYRYYRQNASYFWRKGGNLQADDYVTADPKMSPFHDQTVGGKARVALEFLSFTALDWFHTAVLEFGMEYVFNTNRYGDGVIGQGGIVQVF